MFFHIHKTSVHGRQVKKSDSGAARVVDPLERLVVSTEAASTGPNADAFKMPHRWQKNKYGERGCRD